MKRCPNGSRRNPVSKKCVKSKSNKKNSRPRKSSKTQKHKIKSRTRTQQKRMRTRQKHESKSRKSIYPYKNIVQPEIFEPAMPAWMFNQYKAITTRYTADQYEQMENFWDDRKKNDTMDAYKLIPLKGLNSLPLGERRLFYEADYYFGVEHWKTLTLSQQQLEFYMSRPYDDEHDKIFDAIVGSTIIKTELCPYVTLDCAYGRIKRTLLRRKDWGLVYKNGYWNTTDFESSKDDKSRLFLIERI